jgi:hypothetical protein
MRYKHNGYFSDSHLMYLCGMWKTFNFPHGTGAELCGMN